MLQIDTAVAAPRDAFRCRANRAPDPIGDIGANDAPPVVAVLAATGAL